MRVVVLGASGFVGSAVVAALGTRDVVAQPLKAPRLRPVIIADHVTVDRVYDDVIGDLAVSFQGADVVVNAAGNPDASSRDLEELVAANALLPAVAATSACRAGVGRFVHVSSAAVQGRAAVLDESVRTASFSPYSRSKELGEQRLAMIESMDVVIYRPPSVHGSDRRVTRALSLLARSPLSSVADPGSAPTPQAHIDNVGDAIAYLAMCRARPPRIVIHPWEGFTTFGFLRMLGRREPIRVPRALARSVVGLLRCCGYVVPPLRVHARRLEMVWFGQRQAASWLEREDWDQPATEDSWTCLADQVAGRRRSGSRAKSQAPGERREATTP